jgi:hypothetical protein
MIEVCFVCLPHYHKWLKDNNFNIFGWKVAVTREEFKEYVACCTCFGRKKKGLQEEVNKGIYTVTCEFKEGVEK